MAQVKLKPGHPTGEYRRGGLVFGNAEIKVDENIDRYDEIFNDEWLIVDGKRLDQRKPAEETADAGSKEEEEKPVTQGGNSESGPANTTSTAPSTGSSAPSQDKS